MIVDVHAHHSPEAYLSRSGRLGGSYLDRFTGRAQPEDFEARLRTMDAAGVGRQVLSPTTAPYTESEAEGVQAARLINDLLADAVRARPDRFSMWVSLPLPHVAPAMTELARGLDELGGVGVVLGCFCLGASMVRPEFECVFEALDRRRALVFFHPCQNGICSPLINEWGLTVCAGASMEDSVVAMHLIAGRIPQRYPNIRFIIPHFGGILPVLLERLDGQMPRAELTEAPSVTARRFFYDTVGWGSKAALLAALEAFGESQLVTGSDYPILLHHESYRQSFDHIRNSGLPAATIARILGNAGDLLALSEAA